MGKSPVRLSVAALIALVAVGWSANAQQTAPSVGAYASGGGHSDLITYFLPVEGRPSTLAVIDPSSRRIAVYHVSRENGEIELKSVRNIAGDLGLEYFNSGSPLPQEILKMQQRQQP